jgi:hypothetical protein
MGIKSVDNVMDGFGKLPIKEFKLKTMVDSPSIVMVAKRGSGKSWITRSIMYHFKDIPMGIIIAPTDKMNTFYGKFFPDSYIYYEYTSETIEKLLKRQQIMIEKEKQKAKEGKKVDPRAFIIMDDCLASRGTWMRDQPITELLFNGRHFRVMYILTMQFPLGITPELRGNFDYVFLMKEDVISNLKRIYDHYAGAFPTFDAFRQVFDQLTDDFGAMVINNRGARKSFVEKIFFYKAPNLDNVKVDFGHKQFRKYHEKNYDKNWRNKGQEMDIVDYCMKKKKDRGQLKIDIVHENKDDYGDFQNMNF